MAFSSKRITRFPGADSGEAFTPTKLESPANDVEQSLVQRKVESQKELFEFDLTKQLSTAKCNTVQNLPKQPIYRTDNPFKYYIKYVKINEDEEVIVAYRNDATFQKVTIKKRDASKQKLHLKD